MLPAAAPAGAMGWAAGVPPCVGPGSVPSWAGVSEVEDSLLQATSKKLRPTRVALPGMRIMSSALRLAGTSPLLWENVTALPRRATGAPCLNWHEHGSRASSVSAKLLPEPPRRPAAVVAGAAWPFVAQDERTLRASRLDLFFLAVGVAGIARPCGQRRSDHFLFWHRGLAEGLGFGVESLRGESPPRLLDLDLSGDGPSRLGSALRHLLWGEVSQSAAGPPLMLYRSSMNTLWPTILLKKSFPSSASNFTSKAVCKSGVISRMTPPVP